MVCKKERMYRGRCKERSLASKLKVKLEPTPLQLFKNGSKETLSFKFVKTPTKLPSSSPICTQTQPEPLNFHSRCQRRSPNGNSKPLLIRKTWHLGYQQKKLSLRNN